MDKGVKERESKRECNKRASMQREEKRDGRQEPGGGEFEQRRAGADDNKGVKGRATRPR